MQGRHGAEAPAWAEGSHGPKAGEVVLPQWDPVVSAHPAL